MPDAGGRRVLVVGAGVAGCAVALELLDRGARVTALDADAPGQATRASAGMLTARYEAAEDGELLRLGMWSRALHGRFLPRVEGLAGEEVGLSADGMLVANRDEEAEEAARRMIRWQARELGTAGSSGSGPEPRILDAEGARERHPWASGDVASYLWLPGEARVDAQALAAALPDALRAAGGEVRRAEAAGLLTRDGSAAGVRTAGGERVEADAVVLAAGAWSGRIEGLPRPVRVRPVRGQMLRLEPDARPPAPLLADHEGCYVAGRPDGTVVAGSTMEEVGFEPGVTEAGRSAVRSAAEALAPPLAGAPAVDEWSGLRPVSPDARPILGPDSELSGLHYATGYGRNGVLLAPAAAVVVADLLLEGETDASWSPFRADRF